MKIFFVIEYFFPHFGGVEQVIYEVGRRLAAKNHQITVFTTQEKSKTFQLIQTEKIEKMTVIRIYTPSFLKRYLFPVLSFPFLLYYARNTDIIHSANNYTVAFPVFIAGKLLNKTTAISIWEIWNSLWFKFYFFPFSLGFFLYEKFILSLPFDKFIAPSKFVANQIPNANKTIIHLAHKNLKPDKNKAKYLREKYALTGKFIFLYSGRFGKSKGVEYLIPAFANLVKKYPKVFLILNISNLSAKIKKTSSTLHLSGIKEKDLPGFMTAADCIVTPDLTISFGLATLEASHLGRPVVTSSGGALKEVAYGKVIYVAPGSTESLQKGLESAYLNKFQNIPPKKFSWDKTALNYQKVFLSSRASTFISKSNKL